MGVIEMNRTASASLFHMPWLAPTKTLCNMPQVIEASRAPASSTPIKKTTSGNSISLPKPGSKRNSQRSHRTGRAKSKNLVQLRKCNSMPSLLISQACCATTVAGKIEVQKVSRTSGSAGRSCVFSLRSIVRDDRRSGCSISNYRKSSPALSCRIWSLGIIN